MQTISPDTLQQHHRTLQMLRAATLVVVLAIAALFVVDQVNGTGRSVTPAGVVSSAGPVVGADGSFLDPAVFDEAMTAALARVLPQGSTSEASFLDAEVFDRALAAALAGPTASTSEASFLDADVFDRALAQEMAGAGGGSR